MKILVATESYYPNNDGGAVFERNLAIFLTGRGHEVVTVAPGDRFDNYWEKDDGGRIRRVRGIKFIVNPRYKVSFWPFGEMKKVAAEFKPDIIQVHNAYLIGWAGLRAGRKAGIPVVATNHFMPENALMYMEWLPVSKDFFWRGLAWFHNKFDFVVSPTETAVGYLKENGLIKPAREISNGVDLERFNPRHRRRDFLREKYKIKINNPVILYLGRIDAEKRVDIAIKALAKLVKKKPATLMLAGKGEEIPKLKKLAEDLRVADQVVFAGFVPNEDLPTLYASGDLFVISSPAELQSIVTLEAMASGLPVVATDVGALGELVHNGENGYLFDYEDAAGCAAKMALVLTSEENRQKMGQKSLEIVAAHDYRRVFLKYEKMYQRVIEAAK